MCCSPAGEGLLCFAWPEAITASSAIQLCLVRTTVLFSRLTFVSVIYHTEEISLFFFLYFLLSLQTSRYKDLVSDSENHLSRHLVHASAR